MFILHSQDVTHMVKNTDLHTFNKLFNEYRSGFIRFANMYVRDIDVAEDFTSEAFISYWENREKLSVDSNLPAYLLTIIKNKCLNHLQHIKLKDKVLNNMSEIAAWELNTRIITLEACDPDRLFSEEIQKIIDRTLGYLPDRTREIFILSRYKHKTNKEIAELLNITNKGVEFHISKALKEMRKNLKDYFPLFILIYHLT